MNHSSNTPRANARDVSAETYSTFTGYNFNDANRNRAAIAQRTRQRRAPKGIFATIVSLIIG